MSDQEHEERLDAFMNKRVGKRVYVRQIKADAEKQQRKQRKDAAKKRRQDTLLRKSEPLTKIRKMEKKSRRIKNKRKTPPASYSNEDVQAHHSTIQERFNMQLNDPLDDDFRWYQNYTENYNDWSLQKTRRVCEATNEDERYKRKMEREKEKKDFNRLLTNHKKAMETTLVKINPEFKISKPKAKKTGKLLTFFKRAPGFNVQKVERFYNSLYFSVIVGSKIRVHQLPEMNDDEEVSDCEKDPPGEFECEQCGGEMIVDSKMGQISCSGCGFSKQGGFGVGLKQTFSESQASSRSAAPYERLSHVSIAFLKPSSYPLLKAIHLSCSIWPVVRVISLPPAGGQGFAFSGRGSMRMFPTVY